MTEEPVIPEPTRAAIYCKRWRNRNTAWFTAWRAANKEREVARKKAWYLSHREQEIARSRARRVAMREARRAAQ